MAAPAPSGGGERTILMEAIFGLFVLYLLWLISGGPARIEESKRPFLKPPAPLNTGDVFGEPPVVTIPPFDLKKDIRIGVGIDYSNASLSASSDPETGRKIIEIKNSVNSGKLLNITGWTVRGVMDREIKVIGGGVQAFYQGRVNTEKEIILYPGEKALILPGDSPVGVSFKVNKCSGYLEQFQTFTPRFYQNCPHPGLDQTTYIQDDICSQFMRSILRCNAFVGEYPSDITLACRSLIEANLTYNSCAKNHINDPDFYKGEWRVYLGGEDTFGSKNGDVITIYDINGTKIDSIFSN